MSKDEIINYDKYFAIYARFYVLLKSKKFILNKDVYEKVAFEFGYANQNEISRIINTVRKLKNHPKMIVAQYTYKGHHYDYVYRYNSKDDIRILYKLSHYKEKNRKRKNASLLHGYYLYREYQKMIKTDIKSNVISKLQDDFYYTTRASVSMIIKKMEAILKELKER